MTEVVYRCYLAVVALLALHGMHRLALLLAFRRCGPDATPKAMDIGQEFPFVTVQLPVYNERDVVARLVDAVAGLSWPADRLEIQLLDDSNDDTAVAAAPALARARGLGIAASVLRRPDRVGYKAGALALGLQQARGRYIAIFDADFVPEPDFLSRTVPHLIAGASMVQVRWGHLNRAVSTLTRTQAALLDGHFVVEQPARHALGAWFNFNGTAGVWDRAAIEAAGGWQHDTLTEDLDLSYRALLGGARFVYLREAQVPAEVPDTLPAFLAQQRRWARGSVQTARKLLPAILRADIAIRVRLEAVAHLTANFAWPLCVALAVLLPLVVVTRGSATLGNFGLDLTLVGFSLWANAAFYRAGGAAWRDIPAVLALGIGMGPSQAAAAFEGLFGPVGEFVRTPKNGGGAGSYRAAVSRIPVEALLASLQAAALVWAAWNGHYASLPVLMLFGAGFGWVAIQTQPWRVSDAIRVFPPHPTVSHLTASDEALAGK
jgi:glycosyltransferase involved in cell wall biosynthesis